MPINSEHLASLTEADVVDQNGDKVGSVGQIYLDDASGQPAWVSVKSGLFGLRESFVPLSGADVVDGNISVPYTKDFIKDAPRVDADNHLDDSQQSTLYSYYGAERPTVSGGGAPDPTATFGSDEVSEDLSDGRTQGVPAPAPDVDRDVTGSDVGDGDLTGRDVPGGETAGQDGAVTSEYTTGGSTEDLGAPGAADGNDLGSGQVEDTGVTPEPAQSVQPAGDVDSRAAAIGAAGAAGAAGVAATDSSETTAGDLDGTATGDLSDTTTGTSDLGGPVATDESAPVDAGADSQDTAFRGFEVGEESSDATTEAPPATYQQDNPAAQADWAAEQSPEEPVSTTWTMPTTDPATEEPTDVPRSGYSSDRPAAHSSAYEGHQGPTGADVAAGAGAAGGAGAVGAVGAADEGAVYAADQDASAGAAASSGDTFGTVEPVGADGAVTDAPLTEEVSTEDPLADDAVTGAPDQTGTGYPASPEDGGIGAGGALVGGAAAGGLAAAGVAASDTESAAYEVPGAEVGQDEGSTEFAVDREDPIDGGTEPVADEAWAAGTDGGDASGEPVAGAAAGGDVPSDAGDEAGAETFGPTGYHPDRDGADMTDEERERLNQARGAL